MMMQKLSLMVGSCPLKVALIGFLCTVFTVLSSLSLLASRPHYHPLSAVTRSRYFPYSFGTAHQQTLAQISTMKEDGLNLERALRQTAMPDKTLIITTLNQAWARQNTMIDLFLESFRVGENTTRFLDHLLIVALDQKAFAWCLTIHSHCFKLTTKGVDFSGEKVFMSSDYLRMMWTRIDLLRQVLEEGYSFVFTDADIMWFRDPFPYILPDADFQIACDYYVAGPMSLRNRANGGFLYARTNKRTIDFFKYWYMARVVFPGKHDQEVFNKIKRDQALAAIGLQMQFFDTKYISGFCQPSHDLEKVVTMHANCCYSLQDKVDDLRRILSDWIRFKDMTPANKRLWIPVWSAPKACGTSSSVVH